jgi:exodeoxyribonuclease-1
MFTRQDDLAAGEQRLPIKTIHVNKSPIVIGNLKTLGAAEKRWPLDVPLAMQHAEAAARLGRTLDSLWPAVFQRPDAGQPVDVDEDLYGGFLSQQDRRSLDRWRALGPAALAHKQPDFEDPRLEELLFRYRARNFAHTLDADDQARWQQHLATRLHQGPAGGLSLAAFFERIDTLAEQPGVDEDPRALALLESLVDYAESIAPEHGA